MFTSHVVRSTNFSSVHLWQLFFFFSVSVEFLKAHSFEKNKVCELSWLTWGLFKKGGPTNSESVPELLVDLLSAGKLWVSCTRIADVSLINQFWVGLFWLKLVHDDIKHENATLLEPWYSVSSSTNNKKRFADFTPLELEILLSANSRVSMKRSTAAAAKEGELSLNVVCSLYILPYYKYRVTGSN